MAMLSAMLFAGGMVLILLVQIESIPVIHLLLKFLLYVILDQHLPYTERLNFLTT